MFFDLQYEIECVHDGKPWVEDPEHWNYRAAAKGVSLLLRRPLSVASRGSIRRSLTLLDAITATQQVYGQEPDLTREGTFTF
jgi:hypothetical protein